MSLVIVLSCRLVGRVQSSEHAICVVTTGVGALRRLHAPYKTGGTLTESRSHRDWKSGKLVVHRRSGFRYCSDPSPCLSGSVRSSSKIHLRRACAVFGTRHLRRDDRCRCVAKTSRTLQDWRPAKPLDFHRACPGGITTDQRQASRCFPPDKPGGERCKAEVD